ncbi:MAG: DUF2752 domain-containing protein [Stenotrophomonas chelatiphaga]|jgi:hypothetical protein|uniref:DUF2752 domain-containing protein n=1 Tax=Stenotrophomonas sp. SORGH_AS_0321 TaxID=3041787 RepID=UPI00286343DC|nr:DUF2752 domain-containing protein [Stenotrophomonas sp. SORGH_AS_0321]MDR6093024.1 hypothetical protein [Stenotrophomonas sp. SORGH_AS_0321]
MSLPTPPPSLQRWLPLAAVATLAVGATVVLHNVDPYAAGNPLPSCPLYALTGLYCPGCGSTRCLYSLVHFDLPGAMAMNPLLVLSLPLLLLMLLNGAGIRPRRLDPLMRLLASPMFWLIVLVGYAVLRNLPWAPFTGLAPG